MCVCVCCIPGNGPCLGWRPGSDQPYKWISYGEVEKRAVEFGAGLSALGVETGTNNMIGICSQNNVEVSEMWAEFE